MIRHSISSLIHIMTISIARYMWSIRPPVVLSSSAFFSAIRRQASSNHHHAIGSMCIRSISSTFPVLQYENNIKVVENPHIAKQLSKPSETVKAKHKAWSKIANTFQIGYSKQQHENGLKYYNFAGLHLFDTCVHDNCSGLTVSVHTIF